jgi:hypothetical protein
MKKREMLARIEQLEVAEKETRKWCLRLEKRNEHQSWQIETLRFNLTGLIRLLNDKMSVENNYRWQNITPSPRITADGAETEPDTGRQAGQGMERQCHGGDHREPRELHQPHVGKP